MAQPDMMTSQAAWQPQVGVRPADGDGQQMIWLERCVGDPERFLAEAWATAPYVHRGEPDRFSDLFSFAELIRSLAMGIIPSQKIRILRQDRLVSERIWTTAEKHALVPDGERIGTLIHEGCTLSIRQMEQFSQGLFELCQGLRAELSHAAGANLYINPPHAQGLNTHYDPHDVIVLQLSGEKDWQVFGRHPGAPPSAPSMVTLPAGQTPVAATRLTPGDSLYIPRGFVHSAVSASQSSLHISVGIRATTVADLLRYVLDELAHSPELGQPLMPGFASRPQELTTLLAAGGKVLDQQLGDPMRLRDFTDRFCRASHLGAPAGS